MQCALHWSNNYLTIFMHKTSKTIISTKNHEKMSHLLQLMINPKLRQCRSVTNQKDTRKFGKFQNAFGYYINTPI